MNALIDEMVRAAWRDYRRALLTGQGDWSFCYERFLNAKSLRDQLFQKH